jgi:mannitol/fructose-specific phosphotransferase system IIA component (Ntr-type)
VAQRILEREDIASTATPERVAFLHTAKWEPRLLKATNLFAIGRLAETVDFGSSESAPVDILFLILGASNADHLALLARAAQLVREPGVLAPIRLARNSSEVHTLVGRTEAALFARSP